MLQLEAFKRFIAFCAYELFEMWTMLHLDLFLFVLNLISTSPDAAYESVEYYRQAVTPILEVSHDAQLHAPV
jgi:hypothetical protein